MNHDKTPYHRYIDLYESIRVAAIADYLKEFPRWNVEETAQADGVYRYEARSTVKDKTIHLGFSVSREGISSQDKDLRMNGLNSAMAQCCALAFLGLPVPDFQMNLATAAAQLAVTA